MAKSVIGIDIGASTVKIAVCDPNGVARMIVSEAMPENLLRAGRILSPGEMGDFLKEIKKSANLHERNASVLLHDASVFTRQITVPAMSVDQLRINLPYEFRDFIEEDKDAYFYDYAVLHRADAEDGTPQSFDLFAAAALKSVIDDFRGILRRAGMNLSIALPFEAGYSSLIRTYLAAHPDAPTNEFCFLDLGHTGIRMHLFHGITPEMTKVIEISGETIDRAIAEALSVDVHMARSYKESNFENCLTSESCMRVYGAIGIEIRKALNFHDYEHRENNLKAVHFCGGCSRIAPLLDAIRSNIELPLVSCAELLPPLGADAENAELCACAIGAALPE